MRARKIFVSAILGLCIAGVLSGCGGKSEKGESAGNKLSVYLLEESPFIDVINTYNELQEKEGNKVEYELFPLEDYENMYKRMNNELLAGEGPDILYFDSTSMVNIQPLMKQDAFWDLTDGLKDISARVEVADSVGKEGQTMVIPISYSVPMLFTTKDICEKYGIPTDDIIITEKTLNMLNEKDIPVLANPVKYLDAVYDNFIDYGKKESLYGKKEFRQLISDVGNWDGFMQEQTEVYSGIAPQELDALKKGELMFVVADAQIDPIGTVTIYNQLQNEAGKKLVIFGLENGKKEQELKGRANEMIAVNGNSDKKTAAVRFVKHLLSADVQSCTKEGWRKLSGLPVLESSRDEEIEMMQTVPYAPNYADIKEGIPEETKEKYEEIIKAAEGCSIPDNGYKYSIFDKTVEQYTNKAIDEDTLIEELDKKTQLYLNE